MEDGENGEDDQVASWIESIFLLVEEDEEGRERRTGSAG